MGQRHSDPLLSQILALSQQKMRVRLFFLVLIASFGYFTLGLALAWPASALPSIRTSLNLTLEAQSWVGSCPSFGGFVGSLLSGLTAQRLGARRGLLLCSVLACLGWFLIFLSATLSILGTLFPGIFLIGFSSGFSNPLTSVYVSETVGSGNKGMVTALFNCQVTFGIMATNVLGVILGWQWNSLVLGLLHSGFCFVLFICLPVTPYELVRTGNVGGLKDLLKNLRGESNDRSISEEENFIISQVEEEKEKPGLVATLRKLSRRICSVFMTTIYSQLCGIGIVTAYLIDIFESSINPLTLVLISSFTVVTGSCLQMFAADLLGRKVFLVLCATGMGIGATIFSGIFWVTSHTDSWIFGSENFDELLSNNILVVFTLVLFVGSFQFWLWADEVN